MIVLIILCLFKITTWGVLIQGKDQGVQFELHGLSGFMAKLMA